MNAKVDHTQPAIGGNQATTPIMVRINEACRLTGIGRSKLYELIQAREIEIVKVGSITLVPIESDRIPGCASYVNYGLKAPRPDESTTYVVQKGAWP